MHVESEVVLKCERNNNEGAWHAVLDVRNVCFVRHNDSRIDDSCLEPNEKNHVCGSATCARVWCSVYTSRRLQGNRH